MADRSILFSAPMVQALLAGRKTQTRRVLKPQPKVMKNGIWYRPYPAMRPLHWAYLHGDMVAGFSDVRYAPGDRLWVREAWANIKDDPHCDLHGRGIEAAYRATDDDEFTIPPRWRPGMFMPRWASRLTLTVTDVRVQRLQDVTNEDCIAEGIQPHGHAFTGYGKQAHVWMSPYDSYASLWNSLHGPDAWDANPWVAALTFDVRHGNIDRMEQAHG